MKRYGLHFKNIAAVLMLVALVSLLLPFCKITTNSSTNKISGMGLVKMGAELGLEYARNDTIENDYKLTDNLTWGDIKTAADYASKQHQTRRIALGGAALLLPMGLIFLAMILTLFATGKISMVLPTLFTLLAVLENALLIGAFPIIQRQLLGGTGVTLTFLIGIYLFTILCAVALAILIILWMSGGFNAPEGQEREASEGKGKKKSLFSRDGRRRKKRRRRRGRKKVKKKAGKETRVQEEKPEQTPVKKEPEQKEQKEAPLVNATGQVNGLAGLYQGTVMDLLKESGGTVTLGTTPEAKEILLTGSLAEAHKLEGCNCVIKYDASSHRYTVVSHSAIDIIVQTGNSQRQVKLRLGEGTTVGANTLLFIGDLSNIIKLD